MTAIRVHHGRLDLPADAIEDLASLLHRAEHERAARFRFPRDRRRFVVRRARLRQCLSVATGTPPNRLALITGPFGKPALADGPEFSLSHSGEHWALAIADTPVGIDLEAIYPGVDTRAIAACLFAPGEAAAIAGLPGAVGTRAFFDCWTRKEAFVKAIGRGLSYPLDSFEVSVTREARLIAGANGWAIDDLALTPGLAGALVAHGSEPPMFAIDSSNEPD